METSAEKSERFARYVGEQVRGEAAMRRMSVSGLAKAMGIDRVTLTRYLTGQRSMPIPVLYQAAQTIGIDPSEIIDRAETRMEKEEDGT